LVPALATAVDGNTDLSGLAQRLSNQGKIQTQDEHRKILDHLEKGEAAKGERFMVAHLWRKRDAYKRSRA
jgi:DNA-binding GntR family transcriptional regulator